jgi:hypothetical protein
MGAVTNSTYPSFKFAVAKRERTGIVVDDWHLWHCVCACHCVSDCFHLFPGWGLRVEGYCLQTKQQGQEAKRLQQYKSLFVVVGLMNRLWHRRCLVFFILKWISCEATVTVVRNLDLFHSSARAGHCASTPANLSASCPLIKFTVRQLEGGMTGLSTPRAVSSRAFIPFQGPGFVPQEAGDGQITVRSVHQLIRWVHVKNVPTSLKLENLQRSVRQTEPGKLQDFIRVLNNTQL